MCSFHLHEVLTARRQHGDSRVGVHTFRLVAAICALGWIWQRRSECHGANVCTYSQALALLVRSASRGTVPGRSSPLVELHVNLPKFACGTGSGLCSRMYLFSQEDLECNPTLHVMPHALSIPKPVPCNEGSRSTTSSTTVTFVRLVWKVEVDQYLRSVPKGLC